MSSIPRLARTWNSTHMAVLRTKIAATITLGAEVCRTIHSGTAIFSRPLWMHSNEFSATIER